MKIHLRWNEIPGDSAKEKLQSILLFIDHYIAVDHLRFMDIGLKVELMFETLETPTGISQFSLTDPPYRLQLKGRENQTYVNSDIGEWEIHVNHYRGLTVEVTTVCIDDAPEYL